MSWQRLLHLLNPNSIRVSHRRTAVVLASAGAPHLFFFTANDADERTSGSDKSQDSRSGSDDKEEVDVRRRRRPTSSGDRERADTPSRDREDQVAAPPPRPPHSSSGGAGGYQPPPSASRPQARPTGPRPSSAAGRPMRMGCISLPVLGVILVIFAIITVFGMFNNRGNDQLAGGPQMDSAAVETSASQTAGSDPAGGSQPSATKQALPASAAADQAGAHKQWLIMLYQNADDKILEQDIFIDLTEAERSGSSDEVHIVSQIDRYKTGFAGDGNWSSTKRFYVTADPDLGRIGSYEVTDLGEANMADGDTLVDFVTWAVETYPADKHVLILSDHGMGWPGGWTDPTAPASRGGDSPMEQRLSDQLFLNEIDVALDEIRRRTGIAKFELIGLDACLMAHIEVFSMLEPHARFAVASQETEPAVGWAYTSFLDSLSQNPDMDGAELSRYIVDSYIGDDQRIVDDAARAELTGGRGQFGAPSAQQLASQMETNVTLSAVDLAKLPALMESVNDLAFALQNASQKPVAQARSYAQSYTSVFGKNVPPSYIDLGNFAAILQDSVRNADVEQAVSRMQSALANTVIVERHGSGKKGSNGVSIYFPNSDLYRNPITGYESYVAIANRFAEQSLWDEFLNYHYTGSRFDRAAAAIAAPHSANEIRVPAAGAITASPVKASATSVSPGQTVELSVDISGNNIGYIKLFAGYIDRGSNSIYVADRDYLESDETREIDGIFYPVWPVDEFTMTFDWEPIVFAVDDGQIRAEAVFQPEAYGGSYEDALYSVNGIYTYADDGELRPALAYFRNGVLEQVFGFAGEDEVGAPREILPNAGDTLTVYEQWLDLDSNGAVRNVAYETGKTITFGSQPITWETLDAAAGAYVVGFIIEDLDGKQVPVFTEIRVN